MVKENNNGINPSPGNFHGFNEQVYDINGQDDGNYVQYMDSLYVSQGISKIDKNSSKGFISKGISKLTRVWHQLPEAMKKPTNYTKLAIIAGTAAANGYLTGGNQAATFLLTGVACLTPIVFDFEHHMHLVNQGLLKNKKYKGVIDKTKDLYRNVMADGNLITASALSLIGFGTGAVTLGVGLHLDENEKHPLSNILLSAGTFASGALQMAVKPLIKRAIENKKIKDLKGKGVDVPLVIGELSTRQASLVQRIKNIPNLPFRLINNELSDIANDLETLIRDGNEAFREKLQILEEYNAQEVANLNIALADKNTQVVIKNEEIIRGNQAINNLTNSLEALQNQKDDLQNEYNALSQRLNINLTSAKSTKQR